MAVHDVAARGFAAGAVYERGRPDYPAEAVACLAERAGIVAGARVVDVGAGTGKLARRLVATGARLVAVEPVAGMRATCHQVLPAVPVLGAAAEALPFRDGTLDAVVVGTAFHWFDSQRALREIHRVLRPGGRMGLVWLARDETVEWVARLVRMVDTYKRGDPPRYTDGRWRRAFDDAASAAAFTPLEERQFPFAHEVDRETAVARVASTSFVGALSPDERQQVLERAAALLDTHPATRGLPTIPLPYRGHVYWCTRLPAEDAALGKKANPAAIGPNAVA
jgi:SAM-dependent methyltransferase